MARGRLLLALLSEDRQGDAMASGAVEAAIQQRPGERGCAAAHVDEGISGGDAS